jgi:hypothetical protein
MLKNTIYLVEVEELYGTAAADKERVEPTLYNA